MSDVRKFYDFPHHEHPYEFNHHGPAPPHRMIISECPYGKPVKHCVEPSYTAILAKRLSELSDRIHFLEHKPLNVYSYKKLELTAGYNVGDKEVTNAIDPLDDESTTEWDKFFEEDGTPIEGALGEPLAGIDIATGKKAKVIIPPCTTNTPIYRDDLFLDVSDVLGENGPYPLFKPHHFGVVAECPVKIHCCCCNTPKCCRHGCKNIFTKAILIYKPAVEASGSTLASEEKWVIKILNNDVIPPKTFIPRLVFNTFAADKYEVVMEKATEN